MCLRADVILTDAQHEFPVRIQENAQVKKYTFRFFKIDFKMQNGTFQA